MIVCLCTRLTDRHIAELVAAGFTDAASLMRHTRAGGCCVACRAEVMRLVEQLQCSPTGEEGVALPQGNGHEEPKGE